MAPKKAPNSREVEKTASSDSKVDLSTENEASGARRKTKGTFVKSRYMPTETKAQTKVSVQQPPRPSSSRASNPRKQTEGISSRRTISCLADNDSTLAASILESSNVGGSVFQSTVLDGHCIRPEFDVSVINDKVAQPNTAEPDNEERDIGMETFILAFLTAKGKLSFPCSLTEIATARSTNGMKWIEHNTRKLKEEAERDLLAVMEKEQQLSAQVNRKKRQYLLLEKQKEMNSLLDLQIEVLAPIVAAIKPFSEDYKSFATAIDATRHQLPVKNVDVGEDADQFLDKAVESLNRSEHVLQQYTKDIPMDCEASKQCLKEMEDAANEVSQQVTGTFSDLLEMSSLLTRETVLIKQSVEEEELGQTTAQTLFCPSTL